MSIIPRTKGSLGFTQYLPPEQTLQSKEELFDTILSVLGGRVAEEIFYGEVSSGASDDLEKVYQYAHALVSKLGMTEKFDLSAPEVENQEAYFRNYSEKTHEEIDKEIIRIARFCSERCSKLLQEKKTLVSELAEKLLDKESLSLKDIVEVLGERPFAPRDNYRAFLEAKAQGETKSEPQSEVQSEPKPEPEVM